jgi:hypothetical protein
VAAAPGTNRYLGTQYRPTNNNNKNNNYIGKVVCVLNYALCHEDRRGVGVKFHTFLTSALDGKAQLQTAVTLFLRETASSTH